MRSDVMPTAPSRLDSPCLEADRGKVLPSGVQAGDFMADGISGDAVEFEAVELALYSRYSL